LEQVERMRRSIRRMHELRGSPDPTDDVLVRATMRWLRPNSEEPPTETIDPPTLIEE
jgi:hypothetical protein